MQNHYCDAIAHYNPCNPNHLYQNKLGIERNTTPNNLICYMYLDLE